MVSTQDTTVSWVKGHIWLFEEVLSRKHPTPRAKALAAAMYCRGLAARARDGDAAAWLAEAAAYEREARGGVGDATP